MKMSEFKANAMRWDTFNNKIYFDLQKGSFQGRLILKKNADGKIDMYLVQESAPALRQAT